MASARIFDAFLFDGELTLLEHRLAETADLVDCFILVEAGETFRGEAKAMSFARNRARFSAHEAKIRHVGLPRLGGPKTGPWAREKTQRDAMLFALDDAEPDDIVLILDADEIPSRGLLERLLAEGVDAPQRLLMTRHYERVDRLGPRSPCCPDPDAPFAFAHERLAPGRWDQLEIEWFSRSGVVTPFRALAPEGAESPLRRSPFDLRRTTGKAGAYPDAGRHLCFVDPSAQPARKLGRVAHAELAASPGDQAAHLARCRDGGVHHRGWWYAETPTGPMPEDLARLVARMAEGAPARPLASPLMRRALRTWSWLRVSNVLPDRWIGLVDRHWKGLTPLTLPLLLIIDAGRRLVAALPWRRRGRAPAQAAHFAG